MNEWTTSEQHPGYRCKSIERGNCTITVLRPILSKAEAAKREDQVRRVLEPVMRDYLHRRETHAQA